MGKRANAGQHKNEDDHLFPRRSALYPPVIRSACRGLVRLHYRFFQRSRFKELVLEEVDGIPLLIKPTVFNPGLLRTGAFLAASLNDSLIPTRSVVLDMGTGSGIGAICAARWASEVVAVDVNPDAIQCARINALVNGVEEHVTVTKSDLFASLDKRLFDVILFNPPFFQGKPKDLLDLAWRSPDILERFADQLPSYLAPGGHALLVYSSHGDVRTFLDTFLSRALCIEKIREIDLVSEILLLYRIQLPRGD